MGKRGTSSFGFTVIKPVLSCFYFFFFNAKKHMLCHSNIMLLFNPASDGISKTTCLFMKEGRKVFVVVLLKVEFHREIPYLSVKQTSSSVMKHRMENKFFFHLSWWLTTKVQVVIRDSCLFIPYKKCYASPVSMKRRQ